MTEQSVGPEQCEIKSICVNHYAVNVQVQHFPNYSIYIYVYIHLPQ